MKRILINTIGACIIVCGVASCSSDELAGESSGQGYIQLSGISVDKKVQVRAGENEVIAVDITDADGNTFVHADNWTEIQSESYLVPAGSTYTISAYSAGDAGIGQGFEAAPYYAGSKEVTVKANQAETVEVVCKLAQSQVCVNFSDAIKENFTDIRCDMIGTDGFDLDFTPDETRMAYAKAGQRLRAALSFNYNGQTKQFVETITEASEPATRYTVNYDVNTDGNGNMTVTVSKYVNEYEVTLGMPLKPDGVSTIGINSDPSKVWGQFAILDGQCTLLDPTDPIQFQYKKATDSEWTTVAAEQVEQTNEYTAKVTGLDFGTEYEYKIVCGENEGSVMTFTTEAYEEIPNLNFDTWAQKGNNWYANSDQSDSYWASGNSGVTSFLAGSNDPITEPVEGNDARNGKAAKLHTITGITLVGAAAGNLFIGNYKTNMSEPSASVTFGRLYNGARPVKLKGWYKYSPTAISHGSYPGTLTTDECNVYVTVWDEAGNQIGFGEFVGTETVTEYTPFEFDINYSDPSKKAAKLTIVATSSHYGGHFEGNSVTGQVGKNSTLWIDDFELLYY